MAEALRGAEAIFLCRPEEAKAELRKRIESRGVTDARIVAIETVDKMTERQLAAEVRSVFGQERAGARR